MSTRAYFFAESEHAAERIVDSLKEAAIDEDNIGVISRDENVALTELPDSSLEQRSDLANSLKRGASLGAASGVLAGLAAMAFPATGLVVGGGSLVGMAAGGAVFGAWSASLIGVSEQHPIVEKFDRRLDEGGFLIVADTARDEDGTEELVGAVARKASVAGSECGVYA